MYTYCSKFDRKGRGVMRQGESGHEALGYLLLGKARAQIEYKSHCICRASAVY